jgi:hypothetical protein
MFQTNNRKGETGIDSLIRSIPSEIKTVNGRSWLQPIAADGEQTIINQEDLNGHETIRD